MRMIVGGSQQKVALAIGIFAHPSVRGVVASR